MKIAIAAESGHANTVVSQAGGRAPYYLIFEDGVLEESIKNPFARGSGGAGFSVAYMLANKGADIVIAGQLGGNMKSALEEKGIKFVELGEGSNLNDAAEIADDYFAESRSGER